MSHKDRFDDLVFGGAPPAPEPEVRRDSLGRRITERQLAALRSGQYKPGQSGNPGGSFQRRTLLDAAVRMMKAGKLQPSDSVADFLNLLGED